MPDPLVLVGTPHLVDTFVRPVARVVQVGLGLALGAVLAWAGWWWWVPLPLVLSFLLYDLVFWWRGDRAQTLRLDGHVLLLEDPLGGPPLGVDLRHVTVATLFHRPVVDELEVVVALGDDAGPRFALRVLQRAPLEPGIHDVPTEIMDLMFGGIAGLFRALAPASQRPRQTFVDPAGTWIQALRERIPPDAWRRTGLRLWAGMEPPIDLFGYYEGAHTDWIVLDGRDWRRASGSSGTIAGWTIRSAERSAVLFQGMERHRVDRLPLALLNLGGDTTIAVPAPAAPGVGEQQPLTGDLLHTHAPEGAALLWHLMTHTPRDARPPELVEMIADRRPLRPDLDQLLPG